MAAGLLVAVSLAATACDNGHADKAAARVSAQEQKRLPSTEHTAAQELCPNDVRDPERRARIRRRGERHLSQIVTSFNRHRNATVGMKYATDTDILNAGGEKAERLTVLELAAQWLRDLRYEHCDAEAQQRLVALPGARARSRRPVP
jgi:hypothetical protein